MLVAPTIKITLSFIITSLHVFEKHHLLNQFVAMLNSTLAEVKLKYGASAEFLFRVLARIVRKCYTRNESFS